TRALPLSYSALALGFRRTAELTIRGGGKPRFELALTPTGRLAPPPGASPPMRMTASWSGPQPTYRIQGCGVRYGSIESSPRISLYLRVLRRQGAAKHKRR